MGRTSDLIELNGPFSIFHDINPAILMILTIYINCISMVYHDINPTGLNYRRYHEISNQWRNERENSKVKKNKNEGGLMSFHPSLPIQIELRWKVLNHPCVKHLGARVSLVAGPFVHCILQRWEIWLIFQHKMMCNVRLYWDDTHVHQKHWQ